MAFQVDFYSFTKKENSTARPGGNPVRSLQCKLYTPCSIFRPVLEIAADVKNCNYCYIASFNRYYHIIDITYNNGVWLISCRVDVLATYKNVIGSTPLYILRSSADYDGTIIDKYYPIVYNPTFAVNGITQPTGGGVYCVTCAGTGAGNGLKTYQFTAAQFRQFIGALLASFNNLDFDTTQNAIKNAAFNPLDYIYSCYYFPGTGFGGTSVTSVSVGRWDSGAAGTWVNNVINEYTTNITLWKHDDAATRGVFLNLEPYTRCQLVAPPFGIFPVDCSKIADEETATVKLYIDATTGVGRLHGYTANDTLFDVSCEYGATVPLTQQAITAGSLITPIAGAAAAGVRLAAGDIVGGVMSAASAIGSAADALGGTAATAGGIGSRAKYGTMGMHFMFLPIAEEDNAHNGRPLCKVATPASLGGFLTAQRGDVATAGTAEENAAIKSYLERGFYYE